MTAAPDDKSGYTGFQTPTSAGSERNIDALHIDGRHDERRGLMAVRIVAIHADPNGGAPTADVAPITHQTDGLGNPTAHAIVYGVTVGRVHSGSGAVVSDPVVGDTFAMIPGDRDLSQHKTNGAQPAAPNTMRRSSPSDGVLHHALFTKAPTQAVVFKPGGGVKIFDKGGAVIETSADGKTVTVLPAPGGTLILGGNGSDGATYAFVQTTAGPSTIVKAKV